MLRPYGYVLNGFAVPACRVLFPERSRKSKEPAGYCSLVRVNRRYKGERGLRRNSFDRGLAQDGAEGALVNELRDRFDI